MRFQNGLFLLSNAMSFPRFPSVQTFRRGAIVLLATAILFFSSAPVALAFCGFFVAKADASLQNSASQVIIAHSGNRSVFTMANNFQGEVGDFARIVPIPVIPQRNQVRIGDNEIVDRLDDFTAPRLVEYVDAPCRDEADLFWWIIVPGLFWAVITGLVVSRVPRGRGQVIALFVSLFVLGVLGTSVVSPMFLNQANKAGSSPSQATATVQVEDQFTVGEYDVTILSAAESDDLVSWLRQNDYQVPDTAATMLQSYIQAGMKFFVVRVNLAEFKKTGQRYLRPIVLDYESPQFMLPIRLGTLNATGDQDLIIHILSPDKFAEVANYPSVLIPTDASTGRRQPSGNELPGFIREEFSEFYAALFQHQYEREGKSVAFLEYAGSTSKCDPCNTPPPDPEEIRQAGAFWEVDYGTTITRLHIRYNAQTFPQDLRFREVEPPVLEERVQQAGVVFPQFRGVTFQGRYVTRRTRGAALCFAGMGYRQKINSQRTSENLAKLTGWDVQQIRQKMGQAKTNSSSRHTIVTDNR